MSQKCGRPFDEALITGYLDGVVSEDEDRKVRLHLWQCPACRRLFEELRELRIAMTTTMFYPPTTGSSPGCLSAVEESPVEGFQRAGKEPVSPRPIATIQRPSP